MSRISDRELGMQSSISRRDFLNGLSVAFAGAVLSLDDLDAIAQSADASYYPPRLTGMRGSHVGSFEAAHALAMNRRTWDVSASSDTGESYDLVIVGAGLSGLAAAYFF